MKYEKKKELYEFVKAHATEEDAALLKSMEKELDYADIPFQALAIDDLQSLSRFYQSILRKKLGKAENEEWTMEDVVRVADAMDEFMQDEFSENLEGTIEYEL